jgi:hypothetical protein
MSAAIPAISFTYDAPCLGKSEWREQKSVLSFWARQTLRGVE